MRKLVKGYRVPYLDKEELRLKNINVVNCISEDNRTVDCIFNQDIAEELGYKEIMVWDTIPS